MRKVEKPWGSELIWAETKNYAAKILTINPGHRLSYQYHQKKEETIYVQSGVLSVTFECPCTGIEIERKLNPGETFHVPVGTKHRFSCQGNFKDPVVLFEVSTPELNDVIRIRDDYQR
jgi:mannose-6-phosphate isomerase-like protein (cupin superfamily)